MKYIIDSASHHHIEKALEMGCCGVTANPSMYNATGTQLHPFLERYASQNLHFLSGEVIATTWDEAMVQVRKIQSIHPEIVIKLNFSPFTLKLVKALKSQGIKTAVTLIFSLNQAMAAINSGADYIFPFVGRNEAEGIDGLQLCRNLKAMMEKTPCSTKIVAASIKNLYQLEQLSLACVDYAAITPELLDKSLENPQTDVGMMQFEADWSMMLQ